MNEILLVEDDESLSVAIPNYLKQEGLPVTVARALHEARKKLEESLPPVVLLDWMLPDGQGIDLLREMRAKGIRVPVLLLTARSELIDKVLGLETGANDYLTKPFEPRELIARIRVQLRAQPSFQSMERSNGLRVGDVTLSLDSRLVQLRGKDVEMTRMEFDLLRLLCENPNKVFTRDELLNRVWGYQSFPTTRTVDMHVLQLRSKLGETLFETVRGVGYRLKI